MTHKLLVYGTLRPFDNNNIVLVPGKLYDLGWFPGIVLGNHSSNDEGESFVTCERITVDDERLMSLDAYEGYHEESPESSLYIRQKINNDWIYVYNQDLNGARLIESGDWETHKQALAEA